MALGKPTTEDITKLHNEINQYINQRFLIAMTAITIFGIVGGWMASSGLFSLTSGKTLQFQPTIFLIASVLLTVLLVLFVYSQTLRGSIIVVSIYLRMTGASVWEKDYRKFYRKRPWFVDPTDPQAFLFFILGLITFFIPLVLSWLLPYEQETEIIQARAVLVMMGLVYLIIIVLTWLILDFSRENKIRELWSEIDKDP